MRVMLLGDTHGDLGWMRLAVLPRCKEWHVDLIVQVGDWGFVFYDDRKLPQLDAMLGDAGVRMLWIDGNHENFDVLASYGVDPNGDEAEPITENLTYLPRGYRFDLGSLRCMAFGGAISVDQHRRTPGMSWWSEEAITDAQVERAGTEPVDVLFAHDCPELPTALAPVLAGPNGLPPKLDRASEGNRVRLRQVYDAVRPRLVVHGHYHHRYDGELPHGLVVGLGRNEQSGAFVILDSETGEITDASRRAPSEPLHG